MWLLIDYYFDILLFLCYLTIIYIKYIFLIFLDHEKIIKFLFPLSGIALSTMVCLRARTKKRDFMICVKRVKIWTDYGFPKGILKRNFYLLILGLIDNRKDFIVKRPVFRGNSFCGNQGNLFRGNSSCRESRESIPGQ